MTQAKCYSCNETLDVHIDANVGRAESCPKCRSDVRCCLNCIHYNTNSYNECKETNAERITNKQKANFCDYFRMGSGKISGSSYNSKEIEARKKLDDLFKK